MDQLAEVLLALLLKHAPPGHTAFSVAPAADCAPFAEACPGARWGGELGWVRRETTEQGTARYRVIAQALADEARSLLCTDVAGTRVAGCVPYRGARSRDWRWTPRSLSVAGVAVATLESGFREDIQNGRGHAKRPSEDGGRGRGPSGEACLMQVHPVIAWRFADAPPELTARAKRGDLAAREEIAASLLGTDYEAARRCWRAGLRMLIHARRHCEWVRADSPAEAAPTWTFAMLSLYGTGTSCNAFNKGKTGKRDLLMGALGADFDALMARRLATPQALGGSVSGAAGGSVSASSSSSGP